MAKDKEEDRAEDKGGLLTRDAQRVVSCCGGYDHWMRDRPEPESEEGKEEYEF